MESRALRVLFVANDGFSAGHVARTIAIARAVGARGKARGIETRALIATTSEAHALLDAYQDDFAVVRLPHPLAARSARFLDQERRRIVRGAIEGTFDAFAPDVLVTDTFPSGPHSELTNVLARDARCKRVLVRRDIPKERLNDEVLVTSLDRYDLTIQVADPVLPSDGGGGDVESRTTPRVVNVPPITIGESSDLLTREAARTALGLRDSGARKIILVAAGGGGDGDAVSRAIAIAETIVRAREDVIALVACGPLARRGARDDARRDRGGVGGLFSGPGTDVVPTSGVSVWGPAEALPPGDVVRSASHRVVFIDAAAAAPLMPLMRAFDFAIVPAGYNTVHELAKATVPMALFAQPRPFDDQLARAQRFADAGLATVLETFDEDALCSALEYQRPHAAHAIEAGGASRAADAILDLVTGAQRR